MAIQAEATRESSMLKVLLSEDSAVAPGRPPESAVRVHLLDDARPGAVARGVVRSMTQAKPSEFSAADKSLIRRVHGYMSASQLLGILNEKLVADRGDSVVRYTLEQLRAEITAVSGAVPGDAGDWGSLRKTLATARRDGVLALITEEVIDDFAIVFSLNQKQVMSLKDILLHKEGDE